MCTLTLTPQYPYPQPLRGYKTLAIPYLHGEYPQLPSLKTLTITWSFASPTLLKFHSLCPFNNPFTSVLHGEYPQPLSLKILTITLSFALPVLLKFHSLCLCHLLSSLPFGIISPTRLCPHIHLFHHCKFYPLSHISFKTYLSCTGHQCLILGVYMSLYDQAMFSHRSWQTTYIPSIPPPLLDFW